MRAYEVACVAYEEQSENLCELYAERVELQRRLAHGSSLAAAAALLRVRAHTTEMRLAWLRGPPLRPNISVYLLYLLF